MIKKWIGVAASVLLLLSCSGETALQVTVPAMGNSSSMVVVVQPGTVLCAATRLQPPLKQKSIFFGVVGTSIDPLVPFLQKQDGPKKQDGPSVEGREGCSDSQACPFPGTTCMNMNSSLFP